MAAHRYWRLLIDFAGNNYPSNFAGYALLREIRYYDETNTAIAGGTATTRTEFNSTYNGAAARDGNPGTFWSSLGSDDYANWFKIDFGTDKDVRRFELEALNADTPRGFTMEYSDDDITYTALRSFYTGTWTGGDIRSFDCVPDVAAARRYWRIYCINSADASFLGINELTWYDETVTVVSGGTTFGNKYFNGAYDFNKARDGNIANWWSSPNGTLGKQANWLALDFTTDKTMSKIGILPLVPPDYLQAPTSFRVENSADALAWDVVQVYAATWPNSTAQEFEITGGDPPDPPDPPTARRRPVIVSG